MVEAANFKLPLSPCKLGSRRFSLFETSEQINEVTFQIALPEGSKLHPVFHVFHPRKILGEAPSPQDPFDSTNPGEDLYEVKSILAFQVSRGRRS